MAGKWVRLLSVVLLVAALSSAVMAWASNAPPARAGGDANVCGEEGPGTLGSEGQTCREDCRKSYQQCLETAKKDYERLLEGCRSVLGPREQAACFKEAAEAYSAMIAACKAAFEACVEACGRH